MIDSYFYDAQMRKYVVQFANIFTNMGVRTGRGADGMIDELSVPVVLGNRDRVAAAISNGNALNRTFSVPMMSVWMQGIEMAPERRKGVGGERSKTYLPTGGMFPDDLKVSKRIMPIPYNLAMELGIYASNTDQLHQIIEQILMIFDPILQIQTSDAPFDWTKITTVELTGINNEENYPIGTDRRVMVWTLNFTLPIWISPPMDVKNEVVRKIKIRMADSASDEIVEIDANGDVINVFDVEAKSLGTVDLDRG